MGLSAENWCFSFSFLFLPLRRLVMTEHGGMRKPVPAQSKTTRADRRKQTFMYNLASHCHSAACQIVQCGCGSCSPRTYSSKRVLRFSASGNKSRTTFTIKTDDVYVKAEQKKMNRTAAACCLSSSCGVVNLVW